MRVEQAIYGEVERTHGLRDASGEEQLAREIANRMDLPEATPPGALWSSFISGFPFRKNYIIARTFPDSTAARGGMVFAHALIAPLDEISRWRNVSALFRQLAASGKWNGDVGSLDLTERQTTPEAVSELYGIANALAARGSAPVVRLGCEGFENVLVSLWANLWPEARKQFSFRLSFGPDDLYETPCPAIVCSPSALAGRWAGYRIAATSDTELHSTAARILAGAADASKLLDFGRSLTADLANIDVLRQLESTDLLFHSHAIDELLAAIRFIDNISPSSAESTTKSDILNRLAPALKVGTCENILAMRNLAFPAFPSAEMIWSAMEGWVAKHEFRSTDDVHHLSMLAAAVRSGGAEVQWSIAFQHGIAKAARARSQSLANSMWRWFSAVEVQPSELFALLPREPALDEWLADVAPKKIDDALGEALAKLALERGWVMSHGAILAAFLKPMEAASRQIDADRAPESVYGVRAAMRNASNQDVLQCALDLPDSRLLDLAATAVAEDPEILKSADYARVEVQRVWVAAIAKSPLAWTAPLDPAATRNSILDEIVSGAGNVELVDSLSETPLAVLSDYPNRERLWTRLKGKTQERYLEATAGEWVKRARNGDEVYRPDARLQNQILGVPELAGMLGDRSGDGGPVIRTVALLDSFPELRFQDWVGLLGSTNMLLSEGQSEALGRLVLARRWQNVCDALLVLYRQGRYALKAALTACSDMLSYTDRWRLAILSPTQGQKWEAFTQLAAQLYPHGPADEEVWARAGGRNADLPRFTSGATAWRSALQKIRFGQKPSARELLNQMIKDFDGNEELRFFLTDKDIVGY